MPELPFVTIVVENLAALIAGRTVVDVVVRGVWVLKTFDPPITALRGREVTGVRRQGKLVLLDFSGNLTLIIHLRRNGRLRSVPRGTGRSARDLAFVLAFDRGPDLQMIEMGPKKAASIWLVPADRLASSEPLTGLGIEPFSAAWTTEALTQALRAARMRLKAFLVTQRYVVGIGNTYADEILWDARLSPQAMTTSLDDEEIGRLHRAVVSTLERGIEAHRTAAAGTLPMKEPAAQLAVHRKGGERCPRCGTPVAVIYYEDRETYYCPTCQAEGKVYADRRRSRLLRR
jgi:formamidopyrimidine-DNA glycosylase